MEKEYSREAGADWGCGCKLTLKKTCDCDNPAQLDYTQCSVHIAAPKLLAALTGLVSKPAPFCEDKFGGAVCPYCDCREHPDDCEWLVARNLWVGVRAAIEEAKK